MQALAGGTVRASSVAHAECGNVWGLAIAPSGVVAFVIEGKEMVVLMSEDGARDIWRVKVCDVLGWREHTQIGRASCRERV